MDGGAPTLVQLVLAACMARKACIRAASFVRADLAAASVELAACLMDQMECRFPRRKGARRDDSSNKPRFRHLRREPCPPVARRWSEYHELTSGAM